MLPGFSKWAVAQIGDSARQHCQAVRQAGRRWQQAGRHLVSRAHSTGCPRQEGVADAWTRRARPRSIPHCSSCTRTPWLPATSVGQSIMMQLHTVGSIHQIAPCAVYLTSCCPSSGTSLRTAMSLSASMPMTSTGYSMPPLRVTCRQGSCVHPYAQQPGHTRWLYASVPTAGSAGLAQTCIAAGDRGSHPRLRSERAAWGSWACTEVHGNWWRGLTEHHDSIHGTHLEVSSSLDDMPIGKNNAARVKNDARACPLGDLQLVNGVCVAPALHPAGSMLQHTDLWCLPDLPS